MSLHATCLLQTPKFPSCRKLRAWLQRKLQQTKIQQTDWYTKLEFTRWRKNRNEQVHAADAAQ